MKKILGLSIGLLSLVGVSSLININALADPVATASNFKNAETKGRLKFSYNKESLRASNLKIKFGGVVANADFDNNAEHGVIVVPEAEFNTLSPENRILDINAFNDLNTKHYVLKFNNENIPEVEDKILGKSRQYAWVLNSDMAYDYGYAAAMYEKMGDTVTLAKAVKHSVSEMVDTYIGRADVAEEVKKVLNNYRQELLTFKVDTGFLYGNTPKYTDDGWYDLYVDAWSGTGNHLPLAKAYEMGNEFEFKLSRYYPNVQLCYINKGKEAKPENIVFKSAAFKVENNSLVNNDLVPIAIDLDFLSKNLSAGNMAEKDNLVIYVKVCLNGVKDRTIRLENDENGDFKPLYLDKNYHYQYVEFIFKSKDQNPDDVNQNVWARTKDLFVDGGKLQKRSYTNYQISIETLVYHLGKGEPWNIEPNNHVLIVRYTNANGNVPAQEDFYNFSDNKPESIITYSIDNRYDTVQFIIKNKNGDDRWGHTDEFKIVDGVVKYPTYK